MDNYERVTELQEVAANSEGRADEQFAKFADTVEYKVNQLRNSLEQLRTTFMDSETFKAALDGLNTLVNRINKFNAKDFLALGVAITMVIKVVGKQIVEQFRNIASNAGKTFKNAFTGEIKKIDGSITIQTNIDEIIQKMEELKEKWNKIDAEIEANKTQITLIQGKGKLTKNGQSTLTDADKAEIVRLQQTNAGLEAQRANIEKSYQKAAFNKAKLDAKGRAMGQILATGITAGITATVVANNPIEAITPILVIGIGSAVTQLVSEFSKGGIQAGKAFLLGAGPSVLALTLSIAAISASIVALKNLWNEQEAKKFENRAEAATAAAENAKKESEKAKSTAKSEKDTLTNLKKLKEEYTELNNKQIKTEEEQEKYNELIEKIREDYPEIISYYNETTGELSVQNELWDSLIQKQKTSAQQAEKMAVLQRQIANNAEYTNANYAAIASASSRTGVSGGVIEANLGRSGSWNVTGENLQSSDFASDIDKIAELTGVIAEDGVFTDQNYQDMADALNDGNSELRKSIESANKEIEQNTKQLIQANAIALKDAYLAQNPDAGVGEQALVQAYGLTKDVVQDLSLNLAKNDFDAAFRQDFIDEVLGTASNLSPAMVGSFFGPVGSLIGLGLSEFGGQNRGASRALGLKRSKYADLEDRDVEFGGLRQYDIETVGEFKDALEKMAGSSAKAAELWNETIDDEGKFIDLVEQVVINKVNTETLEKADTYLKSLGDAGKKQLNDLQQELLTNGATQQELDEIKQFLTDTGAEKYEIDISKVNEDVQQQLNEMSAKAIAYGLKDTEGWSTTQLDSWNRWIEQISDAIGIDAAKEFGTNFAEQAQAAGLSTEQLTAAFQSVDWGGITFDTMGDAKERFIANMQEALGDAFDEDKVNSLWEQFFATAEKYNVINIRIKSEDVMNNIRDQALETYDKIIDAAGSAQSAVKKQLTDGFINFSDYRELDKTLKEINLDVNDYVKLTKTGYVLNTNELAKAMGNQVTNEEVILQQAKDKIKLGVEELDNQIKILEALVGESEGNDTINQQLKDKVSLTAKIATNTLLAARATDAEIEAIQNGEDINLRPSVNSELKKTLEDLRKQRDELASYLTDDEKLRQALGTGQFEPVLRELFEKFDVTMEDVAQSAEDNTDKIAAAWDKVKEAQQKVIDKQKELKELTESTAPHQTAGDPMYNYTVRLEQETKNLEKLKEQIEDLSNPTNRTELLNQYTDAAHNEIVTRQAQNRVYQQGANRILQTLQDSLPKAMQQINSKYGLSMSTNFADYMKDLGKGRIGFQWNDFNNAKIPKDVEQYFAEQIQAYNEQLDKIDENRDAIEKRQKEFNDFYKKQLGEYVSLEDEVVNKLKERYQEEIENAKDRNDAIKKADDEYLDALEKAINKERQLRDRQRDWDDLATQEKRLSLMQRDTSGANRIETAKLEKDIEKQREDLLDKSVDDIVDGLKELYETQQESREAEMEYMETMLDNAALVREANEIITSWQSPEDAVNWWKSVTNLEELSIAKQEQEMLKWRELWQTRENYLAASQDAFNEALQTSEAEIQVEVETTGDNVVASVDQNFESVIYTIDESIAQIIQDIEDGKKDVDDALKDYYDLLKEDAEAKGKTLSQWATDSINVIKTAFQGIQIAKAGATGLSGVGGIIGGTNNNSNNPVVNPSTGKSYAEENETANRQRGIDSQSTKAIQSYVNGITSAAEATIKAKNEEKYARIYEIFGGTTNEQKAAENLKISMQSVKETLFGNRYKKFTIDNDLKDEAIEWLKEIGLHGEIFPYGDKQRVYVALKDYQLPYITNAKKFAKGGLVPYTGPAWVDGTPSKPEAFLSAEDTRRIGELAELLENLPIFNPGFNSDNISTTNIGDTTIEVNINIENVSSDYDVDQAVERVKQDIVDAARYTGSRVILKQ